MSRNSKESLYGDLLWNYVSLAIMSLSGLLLNCLIALVYDVAIVGIYNRTYAWYCICSQITVMGIHMSVLRLIPENKEDIEKCKQIVSSALIVCIVFSLICIVLIELLFPYIIVNNPLLLKSMQLAMPGLLFFSINKVLLNCLNGLLDMKAYAFFQSLRYIFMIGIVAYISFQNIKGEYLSLCYLLSELMLSILLYIYLNRRKLIRGKIKLDIIKQHIQFGLAIIPANMVVELNTKVDIVCLGFFLHDDFWIGIYSFAIIFIEGFYQLYVVIRKFFNPRITESYLCNNFVKNMEEMKAHLKTYSRILSPIVLLLIIIGYYIICHLIKRTEYIIGIQFLLIIGSAIVFSGRKIIFGNIFSQTGFPLYESMINLFTVTINFVFNLIFINCWGVYGAAYATAVSHIAYGVLITKAAKKKLMIKI